MVREDDAADLLNCYSDPAAVRFMNGDNCNTDFHFTTLVQMQKYIGFWLMEYSNGGYVRFCIVDRSKQRAVGTIEMFGRSGPEEIGRFGVLRLDLCAGYEQRDYLRELVGLAISEFYGAFDVARIITKAIPDATERIAALVGCGFSTLPGGSLVPYDHYYIR